MSDHRDPHVLVVDDDPAVRALLLEYLGANELLVTAVADGAAMMRVFEEDAIDLVLLDVRLPGENGIDLAMRLRARAPLPIILLTGKAEEADRVMGLEMGADDYVVKPFSPRELLARVRAQLRRARMQEQAPRDDQRRALRFGGWELNLRTRRLLKSGSAPVELSNAQFNLLVALCGAAQRVLSREQLLNLSRLHGEEVYDRNIDVQILRLRRQLESDPSHPQLIVTERGAGYRFTPPVEVLY
jgi:DNA-binding response OmpR family regulator